MAVTPSSQGSISPALLAQLMLAAHHPIISNVRKQPQAAWTAVKRRIHKLGVLYDGESAPVSGDGVYVQTVCRLSKAVWVVYRLHQASNQCHVQHDLAAKSATGSYCAMLSSHCRLVKVMCSLLQHV